MNRSLVRFFFIVFAVTYGFPAFCQSSRPFQMASTAIQAFQKDQVIYFQNAWPGFTFTQLAPDVDMISLLLEYQGIPFAQFAEGDTLPDWDPWAQQMIALANDAKQAGKPLMVQIALTRSTMVGNAIYPDGLVLVQNTWAPACVDLTSPQYSTIGQSYVNYARWVARTFSPQYFVIMVEPNLYYYGCGGNTRSWKVLVNIERDVYRAVKAENPSMILFPSFNLEAIYGLYSSATGDATGFDQDHYDALLAMKRDRLGLVAFPEIARNPYKLPLDYFTRILDHNPNEPRVVLTEAGWNSSSVTFYWGAVKACASVYSEPSFETAFLQLLLYSAYSANFDVVTLWSSRDEMPANVAGACYPPASPPSFSECNNDAWCTWVSAVRSAPPPGTTPELAEIEFKAFGTVGLRTYDGTPKDGLLSLWQQAQQLPIDKGPAPAEVHQLDDSPR